MEENIKDTAEFYQKLDVTKDWLKIFTEKNAKNTAMYERCSPLEGPLISVNNSENQMVHSVTGLSALLSESAVNLCLSYYYLKKIARGVQGLLQTIILGVLSSPVIKNRVFYFSRVSEICIHEFYKQVFVKFLQFLSTESPNLMFWAESAVMQTYQLEVKSTARTSRSIL